MFGGCWASTNLGATKTAEPSSDATTIRFTEDPFVHEKKSQAIFSIPAFVATAKSVVFAAWPVA
jgi:hypothetical protein